MNPSRWQIVNALFHDALERPPESRDAFVREAAGDDEALAREVTTLLASHGRTGDFLDVPAWGVAADLILDDDERSLVGQRIGSYRVLRELGRGGMGVVYAAEDERLGRNVALKALAPEYARDPVRRERLSREARAAAALSHRAIATIFALEDIDGALYIVSELVEGRTLRDELRDGALPPPRLIDTLIDLASALAAAHGRGIIHRDLKPENILRGADGQIKILDFGIAHIGHRNGNPSLTRLTEAGSAIGTPGYMAPEQLSGGAVDARVDLFAFGVLTWELATGEHPFGTDPAAILARMTEIMEGRPSALSRPLPVVGLDRIARRCMRGSPADRYQGAEALLNDLRALRGSDERPLLTAPADAAQPLWWWRFHQGTMAALMAFTPILAWIVRRQTGLSWLFFAVLALATTAVTLRLNLIFTARVHPAALIAHRARLHPWITLAEGGVAGALVVAAWRIAAQHEATAALLVGLAVVTLASLFMIEPATTKGAGLNH